MKLRKEQLEIYKKYGGDEDGLARVGSDEEVRQVGGEAWSIISRLTQTWRLIKTGRTAESFNEEFEASLLENIDQSATEYFKRNF